MRRFGSAALDLAYVAAGRYDGALGVLLGIDCVDALSRARRRGELRE